MSYDFNAEELFILRVCACNITPVRLLTLASEQLCEQWAPFGPPVTTTTRMRDSLRRLLAGGYLIRAVTHTHAPDVMLTDKGASAWEECSRPDWGQFSLQRWRDLRAEEARITVMCGSASFLGRIIGMSIRCLGLCPDFGTRNHRYREVVNWRATYWKTLPIGYFASFTVRKYPAMAAAASHLKDCDCFLPWGRSDWRG